MKVNSSLDELMDFRPSDILIENATTKIRRPIIDVGEFLPVLDQQSIEIARISLASTTGDVISFRLRRTPKKYALNIFDEYGSVFKGFKKFFNEIPTQGELFMAAMAFCYESDGLGFILSTIDMNELTSADDVTRFFYFDSRLYLHLNEIFSQYIEQLNLFTD